MTAATTIPGIEASAGGRLVLPLPGLDRSANSHSAGSTSRCCGFVPPYLLHRIAAERGAAFAQQQVAGSIDEANCDPAVANSCKRTLRQDHEFRERRAQATGELPTSTQAIATSASSARWVIHSADGSEKLPGRVVRTDGEPATGDPAVTEAYDWSRQVWDLYQQQFGRSSFDGIGSTVVVTVHFGRDYDNAFWDGEQLVFGDGDGEIFERFTKPADVLAHEFTHGVVQYTAGFVYEGQAGALNESVADVFASMSVQYAAGQHADQASWLIGEGLFQPDVKARALRSMMAPGTAYNDPRLGKDPQVAHMSDYVDTTDDNGGVHINSGIPNRAFALAATKIGGPSWERAGQVWYRALTSSKVGPRTNFKKFAEATVAAATELFADSEVPAKVRAAWVEVGVLSEAAPPPAPVAADPKAAAAARTISVRRTGGFAGQVRSAAVDLDEGPQADEIRRLLRRIDLRRVAVSQAAPDRFVYTVAIDEWTVTVGERDLSPDLKQVVGLVLDSGIGHPASQRTELPGPDSQ